MANRKKNKSHHFWIVEERYQSGPNDPDWRPTGDDEGAYRLFGTRKWARIWKRSDYESNQKDLRVRKYVRDQ